MKTLDYDVKTITHRYLLLVTCDCGQEYNMEIPEGLTLEIIGCMRVTCACGEQPYFGPLNTWQEDA